jgi:hypothetical protein
MGICVECRFKLEQVTVFAEIRGAEKAAEASLWIIFPE